MYRLVARGLFLSALTILALSACGKSADSAPAQAGASSPAEGSSAPAAPGAPSAGEGVASPPGAPDSKGTQLTDARRPVATVNGVGVPGVKVDSVYRMNRMMLEQRGRQLSPSDDQILREQSLEQVLADELLHQAAVARGIAVKPEEVDAQLNQIKQRAGTPENFQRMLRESGLSDKEIRGEVERNIRTDGYRKTLIAGKTVSEADAKKYYDENAPKGVFNVPDRVHCQFILVKSSDKDPAPARADAKKRADEAAKRAAAGEDFGALAKQYSRDPSASRGGDIGLIPKGVMFPKFEEVAFAAKPGTISPVFETPNGFNILKVLEKMPPSTQTFQQVKPELMREMSRMMEQDVVRAKVKELAATAKVIILDPSYQAPQTASAAPPPATTPAKAP